MKTIALLTAAVVAGAVRYPVENPITVRDDDEAVRLIVEGLAVDPDEEDDRDELDDEKVEDLKKIAAAEGVDLGDKTKKADIVAAIRGDELDDEKVEDLKKIAAAEGVDLGDKTKKADIVAAIRAYRASKEA